MPPLHVHWVPLFGVTQKQDLPTHHIQSTGSRVCVNAPLLRVGDVRTCNDSIDSDYRLVFGDCNVIWSGLTLSPQHLEPLAFGNASEKMQPLRKTYNPDAKALRAYTLILPSSVNT